MKIIPFNLAQSNEWDNFIQKCPMSTFLHTRRFLSYHKNRFIDKSFIIVDDKEEWLGVFLAALNPNNALQIISHPGLTYGGILHHGKLNGSSMIHALELLIDKFKEEGFSEVIYKAIPVFYHKTPACDDLYALFRLKFQLYRRDLSSTIDLTEPSTLSNKSLSKMRNMLNKAQKNEIYLDNSLEKKLESFWHLLTKNLKERHQSQPVHSLEEIQQLLTLFPHNIHLWTACLGDEVLAGTILFTSSTVMHTQYLAVSEKGKEFFSLDFLIQFCLNKAKEEEMKFFDFGISTQEQGKVLNEALYFSKTKHGSSGTVHDFYRLSLV